MCSSGKPASRAGMGARGPRMGRCVSGHRYVAGGCPHSDEPRDRAPARHLGCVRPLRCGRRGLPAGAVGRPPGRFHVGRCHGGQPVRAIAPSAAGRGALALVLTVARTAVRAPSCRGGRIDAFHSKMRVAFPEGVQQMRMILPLTAFLFVAMCAAQAGAQQVTKPTVPGASNFAKLETTVACGGATTPEAVPELKKMGYKSIINLRIPTEAGANVDAEAAAAT